MLLDPDLGYFDESLDLTDAAVYRSARLSHGQATTLPPASYRSKVFSSLEDNRVWTRDWVAVGSGLQIPYPGDILPFTIGYHGVHFQRMPDGSIEGRFNKAQHGGCRTVPLQCQTGSRTKCSFTACGYSRDRDVIPAHELDADRSAAQQYLGLRPDRLLPVRFTEIHDVLFACLDPRTPDIETRTPTLQWILKPWSRGGAGLAAKKWTQAPANWKLIGSALSALLLPGNTSMQTPEEGVVQVQIPELPIQIGDAVTLPTDFAGAVEFIWTFPNLLVIQSSTAAVVVLLQPLSMSETALRVLCFGPEDRADEILAFGLSLLSQAGLLAAKMQGRLSDWGTSRAPETVGQEPPFQDNPVGVAFQQFLIDSILTPRS